MSTKVLVIEDDLEINELLGEYLGLEGIQYLQATTGEAGIHIAGRDHPDAVILDLMLPDIDGFEVARTLAMHRATFDIPIIILSCMCQDCDKEKAFGSGAMFFMNKPFLPDDLITTVRQALEWKRNLTSRTPAGTLILGGSSQQDICSPAIGQMVADLFARTELTDAAVAQIREAMETMSAWGRQWNAAHTGKDGKATLNVEYRIGQREKGIASAVEWKLSEDTPGMLAEAFFADQTETNGSGNAAATSAWTTAAGLLGWGTSALATRQQPPIAPPPRWLEVLAKTGAARFEKDTKSRIIRFSRSATPGPTPGAGPVPVVEIDGTRFPTRLRDEALAAKRK